MANGCFHGSSTSATTSGMVHSVQGSPVVTVYPHGAQDRLLLNGFSVEVWMQRGSPPASLPAEIATFYRRPWHDGRLALVLGAGNIASIPALDVLYRLYVSGEVVILKLNPVNACLGPTLRLRSRGCRDVPDHARGRRDDPHPGHTHDVIIYGPGGRGRHPKGPRRATAGEADHLLAGRGRADHRR